MSRRTVQRWLHRGLLQAIETQRDAMLFAEACEAAGKLKDGWIASLFNEMLPRS